MTAGKTQVLDCTPAPTTCQELPEDVEHHGADDGSPDCADPAEHRDDESLRRDEDVVLLSRVVVQLGELSAVTTQVIEGLFASDMAYLEDLYQRINSPEYVVLGAVCPQCNTQFQLQVAPLESIET